MPDEDEDDDELLSELPPLGDDEELPDDAELGFDGALDEDDARSDLDDSAGVDEDSALFALDLPPEEDPSEAAEEGVDAIPVEGLEGDEEYGWTDQPGTVSDESWEPSELDLPSLAPLGRDDGGEEGVEDVIDLGVDGDDHVPHLPALGAASDDDEEGDDELGLGADALLEARFHEAEAPDPASDDDEGGVAPAPPPLARGGVTLRSLGPPDDEVRCLDGALAGGAGLYDVGEVCAPRDLAEHELISIATEGARVVVGTRDDGVLVADDGVRFVSASGLPAGGAHVIRERGDDAPFWARTDSGGLYRSRDGGHTWTGPLLFEPVVAIAPVDGGGVVALSRAPVAGGGARTQLARSDDAGERWAAVEGPRLATIAPGTDWSLALDGDHLAVTADADPAALFVSGDRGKTWRRVSGVPAGGALAALMERGQPVLYAGHYASEGRAVVMRVPLREGAPRVVLDVTAWAEEHEVRARADADAEHRVHVIEATHAAGVTTLRVGTGVGLLIAEIDVDAVG